MKKTLIAPVLCLALALSLLAGCGGGIGQYNEDAGSADAADTTTAPEDTAAPAADTAVPEPTPDPGLGYAAYAPDTVVAVCAGRDITWREYYYWLNYYAGYIDYMTAMGVPWSGWDGHDYDPDLTNAQLVADSASISMLQLYAMEKMAADAGVSLDEEDRQSIQDSYDQAADSYGDQNGECSQEEADAYAAYLDGQFVDRALYDFITGSQLLADKVFAALYGEEGENMPAEDVLAWADSQGVMACKHILLMTVDQATNQPLDDDAIAGKKAQADELYAQLAAVEDDPAALEALFDELMNANSEDTGLAAYPDGYIFTPGVMVSEFESATQSLEEYGLSQPVQSSYGYHIILRLPVDPEGSCTTSSGAAPLRISAANADFTDRLNQATDGLDVQWQNGMDQPDIPAIFGD